MKPLPVDRRTSGRGPAAAGGKLAERGCPAERGDTAARRVEQCREAGLDVNAGRVEAA
jgi:hypothetical protein